jgi:hypothetical protein
LEIRLRDSYLAALAKLGTAEQERIQKFISKLNSDPTTLGLHVEPIDNGFVSIRANQRLRVIAQQQGETLSLYYIGDHDPAYDWAKKRRLLASLESGNYCFEPDEADAEAATDEVSLPAQTFASYGSSITKNLERAELPAYIVRGFETCQNEDELYERLETLPENLKLTTLAIILGEPYEPQPTAQVDDKQVQDKVAVSPLQNLDALSANSQEDALPITEKIVENEASLDFAAEEHLPCTTETDVIVTYNATRLLFRSSLIEPLSPSQIFRIVTPLGVFEMSKSAFYETFPNVIASASYKENGIYHYAHLPKKALVYRVDDNKAQA